MSVEQRFSRWMSERLGIEDARLAKRLSGGNANVTQLVTSSRGPLVIRRPPDNAISASAANGVRREYRVLGSLQGRAPVPTVHGFCDDGSILGQPFLVVEYVEGTAISTALPPAYAHDLATLRRIGEELVDGIATVHRLDWRSLGVEAPASGADYVSRQLERFVRVRAADKVRDLPLLDSLGAWLLAHKPRSTPTTLIHGDYHLDNTLFRNDAPRLAAIIDWELATVGDPLADVALMLMFWGPRPGAAEPPGFSFVQQVSRVPGVVSREELAARWSSATGIAIDDLQYYLCFAFWRLAAIVEGAYVLYRKGLVTDDYSRKLEHDVPALLEEAARTVGLR